MFTRKRFLPCLLADQELETRELLSGPTLNVSKDIWNFTNNTTTKILSVVYNSITNVSTVTVSVSNNTSTGIPHSKVNNTVIVLGGKLPQGVTPGGPTGAYTSKGDSYFVLSAIPIGSFSPALKFNGKLPPSFRPTIEILVSESPFIPPPSPAVSRSNLIGTIDFDNFDAEFKRKFNGVHSPTQISNLNTLVGFIENDPNINDIRWAAYMLATAYAETPSQSFSPGAESKASYNGKKYAQPVKSPNGGTFAYFGRGYGQLTWAYNYAAFGDYLANEDVLPNSNALLNNPNLYAERPDIAYAVFSYGMRSGAFAGNGLGLANYITATKTDYVNARNIVNGNDNAANKQQIASNAKLFATILRSANTPPPPITFHFSTSENDSIFFGTTFSIEGVQTGGDGHGIQLPQIHVTGTIADIGGVNAGKKYAVNFDIKPTLLPDGTWEYQAMLANTAGIIDLPIFIGNGTMHDTYSYSLTISGGTSGVLVNQSLKGVYLDS